MQRFIEIILGLDKGFLGRDGDLSVQFNPRWPFQDAVGAVTWNLMFGILAGLLIIYVYRREGRSRTARIFLGLIRATLMAFVIAMLNRPVMNLSQSRTEPSVLAIAMDDSVSMQVKDGQGGAEGQGVTRMQSMLELLNAQDKKLIKDLARQHELKFYKFNRDARLLPLNSKGEPQELPGAEASPPTTAPTAAAPQSPLETMQPTGQSTQILASMRTVLENLQGQRLAGVVLLTDGRNTPIESLAEVLAAVKNFGVKVYPVAIGSDKIPQNLIIESINVQDAAFVKDIVSVKVMMRGMGYPAGHQANIVLKTKQGKQLIRGDGRPSQEMITLAGDAVQEVELTFKPSEVGNLDLVAEIVKQQGEIDEEDNSFPAQIAVLDAKIAVLYCDGYPRWEYRYLKNEMIRDSTVDISCLLFSADSGFAQEGDKPITRFPESMTEMLAYDVVIFGDVDPRQFTDRQLQLINDFVAKKGGGFGMVSGPKWSPIAYRNTAIEPILPVSISRVAPDESVNIAEGWRPFLTREGANSTIFRFFERKDLNEKFLKEEIQPIFWYQKGVTVKPGAGEVYAEHPKDTGPDGRKAPILVMGRFGAGRTLFSGIDDSWRWRFYTGENVFDTYWIQQLRYLARSKKLGQRRFTLTTLRPAYELGEQISVGLRVLDPDLLQQLPEQVSVTLFNEKDQPVRQETMQRQEGQTDYYVASWTADAIGRFVLKMPALAGNTEPAEQPITVKVPRLELSQPQVDRTLLTRIAAETLGEVVPYDQAREKLPSLITSAAKIVPVDTNQRLWDAPLAMAIFVLLIVTEWVLRKVYGML
jgi:uncharacterized membrane protein